MKHAEETKRAILEAQLNVCKYFTMGVREGNPEFGKTQTGGDLDHIKATLGDAETAIRSGVISELSAAITLFDEVKFCAERISSNDYASALGQISDSYYTLRNSFQAYVAEHVPAAVPFQGTVGDMKAKFTPWNIATDRKTGDPLVVWKVHRLDHEVGRYRDSDITITTATHATPEVVAEQVSGFLKAPVSVDHNSIDIFASGAQAIRDQHVATIDCDGLVGIVDAAHSEEHFWKQLRFRPADSECSTFHVDVGDPTVGYTEVGSINVDMPETHWFRKSGGEEFIVDCGTFELATDGVAPSRNVFIAQPGADGVSEIKGIGSDIPQAWKPLVSKKVINPASEKAQPSPSVEPIPGEMRQSFEDRRDLIKGVAEGLKKPSIGITRPSGLSKPGERQQSKTSLSM